ncbi:MAG: hypothetical protein ACE5IR_04390 [bacterium]
MILRTGNQMKRIISNERGLTLLEICLTLLVLGLLVAAANPRLSRSYRSLKLKLAAESTAEDLFMVYRRAILSGSTWRVTVWEDGRGYTIEQQGAAESADPSAWQSQPEWHVQRKQRLASGVKLSPRTAQLEWSPNGEHPQHVLHISSEKSEDEDSYEIQISKTKITIQRAESLKQ